MKKKLAVLAAGICALSLFLTGCSGEISNDYVTITKYKGVEIDKVDADAVSDNDVEAQINSVLQSKSTTTEVTDRAAQTGDTVTIDYEGKKDGVAFDGGTATDAQLTLGSGQFIDGFEDGVVGHNIGDTFDLDLTFPENYGNEDLAGQAVVFTVTLKGISQTDVPELTDEFVQSVSDTSKTVEEYKKEIKKSLKKNGKENQQNGISTLQNEHEIVNCFFFGPALVVDGEVQGADTYDQYAFDPTQPNPRAAIGQIGPLTYAVVVVNGRTSDTVGVTMEQLATIMGDIGCQQAYNLDGGNSATLVFHNEIYSAKENKERSVSDIIYFASAIGE